MDGDPWVVFDNDGCEGRRWEEKRFLDCLDEEDLDDDGGVPEYAELLRSGMQ